MGVQVAYHGYLGWLSGAWRHFWLWDGLEGIHGCSTVHIYLSLFIGDQLVSVWPSTIPAFLCTTDYA